METPEPSRLSLLKEYLGNDAVQIKEMVQLFLETFPADLLELETACQNHDFTKLQKTSHRLKSSVQLFNIGVAREKIVLIESRAKSHEDCNGIFQLVQQFKSCMQDEVKNIRTELQRL